MQTVVSRSRWQSMNGSCASLICVCVCVCVCDVMIQGYAPAPGQRVALPHVALTAPLVVVAGALTVLKAVGKATGKS
jgi:Mg2+/Co2+ transporter CorB